MASVMSEVAYDSVMLLVLILVPTRFYVQLNAALESAVQTTANTCNENRMVYLQLQNSVKDLFV